MLATNDYKSTGRSVNQRLVTSNDIRRAAERTFHLLGSVAVFPAFGKGPICTAWEPYRARPGIYGSADEWRRATGYCVAPVNGSALVILDIDEPPFYADVLAALPALRDTYTVHRGNHVHVYLWIANPLPKATLKRKTATGGECASLRGAGAYVIGAGSAHYNRDDSTGRWIPTGDTYHGDECPVIHLAADQTAALLALFPQATKPTTPRPVLTSEIPKSTGDLTPRQRAWWIDAVTQGELRELARAIPNGKGGTGRNDRFNDCLIRLFAYTMQDTRLQESDWLPAARSIIAQAGLSDDEINRTVESARRAADPAEKPLPTWWSETVATDPLPEPASPAAQVNSAPAVQALPDDGAPAGYPDGLERCVFKFWRHAGKSVNRALRAAWEFARGEPFTLPDLAVRSGVPYKALWTAFEEYGAAVCFQKETASSCLNSTLTNDSAIHRGTDSPHGQTGIKSPLPQKQPTTYRWLSPGDLIDALVTKVIAPALAEKHGLARATLTRLQALGVNGDPDLVTGINTRIIPALTSDERDADCQAMHAVKAAMDAWRQQLADPASTPLPDTWAKDYVGAVVERNDIQVLGESQSWAAAEAVTGLKAQTIRRAEERIGITRDEQYSDQELVTDKPDELPPQRYDRQRGGFPARVTLLDRVTPSGELPMYDYRGKAGQIAAQEATQGGERVRIEYQTASIPRRMTDEEKAARQNRPPVGQPTKHADPQPKAAPALPHVGPGTDPIKAIRWLELSELILHLPADSTLTLPERVYRLAGRPVTTWIEHSDPDQVHIDDEPPDDGGPGQVLYETWAKQPNRAAQDAYIDTLTFDQVGLLLDYRQAIRRAA